MTTQQSAVLDELSRRRQLLVRGGAAGSRPIAAESGGDRGRRSWEVDPHSNTCALGNLSSI
jgi:hypothetical protein